MKVRQGFVSNSSSSSFIVAFPKDLELTPEAVKKYLFGDLERLSYYDYGATTQQIAEQVCRDMLDQKPNSSKEILDAMGGYLPGAPDYHSFRKPNPKDKFDYDWDAYEKATQEFRKKCLAEFKKDVPKGMNLYVFEYSDNDGSFFCTMEHGGTFHNVKHIQISNH